MSARSAHVSASEAVNPVAVEVVGDPVHQGTAILPSSSQRQAKLAAMDVSPRTDSSCLTTMLMQRS